MPMTYAPYILPIWHAKEPTEPAAPDTTSVSPALIFATSNKPFFAASTAIGQADYRFGQRTKYAVKPAGGARSVQGAPETS
jgi:hypothetical protein